ncbi:MAG: GDSL-type esterase/lipase family protein [Caldilineaceae bacterium]
MKQPLFFLNLLFLSVALVACGADESAPAATPVTAATDTPIRVVAMGDSLTEGLGVDPDRAYPAQLARKLVRGRLQRGRDQRRHQRRNHQRRAFRVDWVLSLDPDVVILATGGNDGLRHRSVSHRGQHRRAGTTLPRVGRGGGAGGHGDGAEHGRSLHVRLPRHLPRRGGAP